MRPTIRPLATAAALALLAVVGGGVGAPGTANAASYRYWSFWVEAGDSWSYAQVGAGSTRPADGSVQGWRFAISAGANTSTIPPRAAASFATICGADAAPDGRKRVALVVDFGTTADAPAGETPPRGIARVCVEAPASATGAAVLAQAFAVRSKDGLVCGIDGYPRTECAAIVREPAPTSSARPSARPTSGTSGAAPRPSPRTIAEGAAQPPRTQGGPTADPAKPATSGASTSDGVDGTPAVDDRVDDAPTAPTTDDPILVVGDSGPAASGSPWGVALAAALLVGAAATVRLLRRRSA
jgi:hypothetical protein